MTRDANSGLSADQHGLEGVLLLEPAVYRDHRGSFRELFNQDPFEAATGVLRDWVQDSYSTSKRDVLRGIHYQMDPAQGKLVSCVVGEVFDVAVDLRRSSPTFGEWTSSVLSEENGRQLWIPEGFGHGFLTLSEDASVHYKVTAAYEPAGDRSIVWNDPDIDIDWPLRGQPILADKDRMAPMLAQAQTYD